jgi:hypothetical protein
MNILISDFHVGCQLWQRAILEKLGHTVTINSFSGHRFLLDKDDNLTPYTRQITNSHDIKPMILENEIKNVSSFDTILVSFPPKCIDLYDNVTCKYPKILNAGHRLHIHTTNDPTFLQSLIQKVVQKKIILCSMDKYDTEYIKHYTGISPIELDVACFHIPESIVYNPSRFEILISPVHASNIEPFQSLEDMNSMASTHGFDLTFSYIKSIYNNFKYEDLVNHRAAVLFPYSVFSISMIEMYELNIPIFVPSKQLIESTNILNDVSIYPLYGSYEEMKRIDIPHKNSPHKYSPNSTNYEDKMYWLDFTYFNTKENVIYWDNPLDLFTKLTTIDLQEVSNKMKLENERHRVTTLEKWKNFLDALPTIV